MRCCDEKSKECGCGEGGCDGGASCEEPREYSNGLAAGKFVTLSVVSAGFYFIYWFYRNWKNIKDHTKRPIKPVGRTIAAVFPILDIVLFCVQLKDIHGLAKKQVTRSFPLVWTCVGVTVLIIALWAVFAETFVALGPELFMLFYVSITLVAGLALVLLPAQLCLNDLWEKIQGAPTRQSYTCGEKAWLVVGGIMMFFDFLLIFVAPPPPLLEQPGLDYYPQDYSEQLYNEPLEKPENTAPREKPAEEAPNG